MRWKTYPKSVLLVLLALQVLAQIDRNMLLGFSQVITQELGLSNIQYAFLVGAVWVLSFGLMALLIGMLADRYSRTTILGVGLLIWSFCTAASGAVQSYQHLVLARLLVATGEATLVPIAISVMAELFDEKKRGAAIGLFFMGIPLGLGLSFYLAGSLGASYGWRLPFYAFGLLGLLIAIPLFMFKDVRPSVCSVTYPRPSPLLDFIDSTRQVWLLIRQTPALKFCITGFILIHFALVSLSFVQLWIARDLGVSPIDYAKQMGLLQIIMGILGSLIGGVLSDRLSENMPGGKPGLIVALITVCAPLMIAYRFSEPGSVVFYTGICAGIFLPMATYGPTISLIQQITPNHQRSGITGFCMLLINVFAIAFGSAVVGWASDRLNAAHISIPLTRVLLACDLLAIGSVIFFVVAAFELQRAKTKISIS